MFTVFFIHLYTWHLASQAFSQFSFLHPASTRHTAGCMDPLSVTSATEDSRCGQRPSCSWCQGLLLRLEYSCSPGFSLPQWELPHAEATKGWGKPEMQTREGPPRRCSAQLPHPTGPSGWPPHSYLPQTQNGIGGGAAPCPFLSIHSQIVHPTILATPSGGR